LNPETARLRPPRALIFTSGIAVIVLISLGIFYWLMRPPLNDLEHMAQFLSITAAISILIGYAAYRSNWLERAPSLRWVLLGTYILASLLTFLNVWLTARLMFASEHDLMLATVLLVFAGAIAVALGAFITAAITDRLARLRRTTQAIQSGDLSARAEIGGNDEIALLAGSFNQMAQQLQQADQKQKELDALRRDLVAWAGHDLRTPLSSIRLLVEALADGVVSDPQMAQSYLEQTRKNVATLSLLVDDLFQISQLDAGGVPLNIETASLGDLISDTLESFRELAAQKGVSLSGAAGPGVDPLRIDVLWLGRALNNLVSNAIRHTPAGGSVTVTARLSASQVLIEVQDSGEGIAAADLPHIFERFYRGEKSRSRASGGAGLGLAITRGIIEAHGGFIMAESQPGHGACFICRLPRG
jgi:signal transduction histidine kinase